MMREFYEAIQASGGFIRWALDGAAMVILIGGMCGLVTLVAVVAGVAR